MSILAHIADPEGRAVEVRNYRRRERETFAAFERNRYHIDHRFGPLIATIAVATQGSASSDSGSNVTS